jgi:hypothetical protein
VAAIFVETEEREIERELLLELRRLHQEVRSLHEEVRLLKKLPPMPDQGTA